MSENGEIYTAGKNFTLPPALTALTNSTSVLNSSIFLTDPLKSSSLRIKGNQIPKSDFYTKN